jgi:hypothetical protein
MALISGFAAPSVWKKNVNFAGRGTTSGNTGT